MIECKVDFANGKTLDYLSKMIQKRMEYLGESSRDACAACGIQVLKSLRAVTLKANPKKDKLNVVKANDVHMSFKTSGGKRYPALRVGTSGSKESALYQKKDSEIIKYTSGASVKMKSNSFTNLHVYRFTRPYGRTYNYLIVALNKADAERYAMKELHFPWANQKKGLAKIAFGLLMHKIYTKAPNDNPTPEQRRIAESETSASESVTGGGDNKIFTLKLENGLDYAMNALKGGHSAIDTQMRKALNMITATFNRRLNSMNLEDEKLETPFPEVLKRK